MTLARPQFSRGAEDDDDDFSIVFPPIPDQSASLSAKSIAKKSSLGSSISDNLLQFSVMTGKIAPVVAYGVLGYHALKWAANMIQKRIHGESHDAGSLSQHAVHEQLRGELQSISEIKKEQQEIWSAILNIHNTQSESTASVKALQETAAQLEGSSGSHDNSATAAMITELRDSTEIKIHRMQEMIAKLQQLVDDVERDAHDANDAVKAIIKADSARIGDELNDLKADLRDILGNIDALISKKNAAFKEDLLKILRKNKPSGQQ